MSLSFPPCDSINFSLCPDPESNRGYNLRRIVSYPLNDRSNDSHYTKLPTKNKSKPKNQILSCFFCPKHYICKASDELVSSLQIKKSECILQRLLPQVVLIKKLLLLRDSELMKSIWACHLPRFV